MTIKLADDKKSSLKSGRQLTSNIITLSLCAAVFLISLFASDKIAHSVKSALSLCSSVIIPSVFPFIIISDVLYTYLNFSSMNALGYLFEKAFKINRAGLYPFILGILCGFPLGVKCASELYRDGVLSKDETERIIGFCNNTGPAFLVSGIGLGLRKNVADGILLYFIMVATAVITGIIFSTIHSPVKHSDCQERKRHFSFTASIKSAGESTINICSYLTFFACIVGLLRNTIRETYLYLCTLPLLEIGSAASILSKTKLLTRSQSLCLTSFAVGFSGLSVHLQALSFISDTDLSVKRYFLMKSTQGALSFALCFLLNGIKF